MSHTKKSINPASKIKKFLEDKQCQLDELESKIRSVSDRVCNVLSLDPKDLRELSHADSYLYIKGVEVKGMVQEDIKIFFGNFLIKSWQNYAFIAPACTKSIFNTDGLERSPNIKFYNGRAQGTGSFILPIYEPLIKEVERYLSNTDYEVKYRY
jgi:hypothetical protein